MFEHIPVLVYSSNIGVSFAGFVNGIPLASATDSATVAANYIYALSCATTICNHSLMYRPWHGTLQRSNRTLHLLLR